MYLMNLKKGVIFVCIFASNLIRVFNCAIHIKKHYYKLYQDSSRKKNVGRGESNIVLNILIKKYNYS